MGQWGAELSHASSGIWVLVLQSHNLRFHLLLTCVYGKIWMARADALTEEFL